MDSSSSEDEAPDDSFEHSITSKPNPLANSPLLLKRGSPLSEVVEGWCEDARKLIQDCASELGLYAPDTVKGRLHAPRILCEHLDDVLRIAPTRTTEVGKSGRGSGSATRSQGITLNALALQIAESVERERDASIDQLVASYAAQVSADEPATRINNMRSIMDRRRDDAEKKCAGRVTAAQMMSEATRLKESDYTRLDEAFADLWEHLAQRLDGVLRGLDGSPKKTFQGQETPEARSKRAGAIELAVERTIHLIRIETLKDVAEVNLDVGRLTQHLCRVSDVRSAIAGLRNAMEALPAPSGVGSREVVEKYCSLAFRRGRADLLAGFLAVGFASRSSALGNQPSPQQQPPDAPPRSMPGGR